jgi:hypothetical protein
VQDLTATPDATSAALLPALPVRGRDRLRLVLVLGLLALWVLPPWARAQVGDGHSDQIGAVRTGATAALALLVLGGLTATSMAASTLAGLRAGVAVTHALIAAVTTVLLLLEHPWLPGGALRSAWVPVFAPLALLAALDAWRAAVDPDHGDLLAVARTAAGLFAAAALYVADAPIPAGIAAWLGLGGLALVRATTARGARRALEALVLVAALLAGAAPQVQARLVGVDTALDGTSFGAAGYGWVVLAAILATTGVDGVLRPAHDPDAV